MIRRSLNLDGMFVPTPYPQIGFTMHHFSGGELHIKVNQSIHYDSIDKVVITNRINNTDNLMEVLIAKDALEREGIKHFDLIMPYTPYARQDRQCELGESFTLKVFAKLLNSAKFDRVYILDAHSDVAPALINNSVNIPSEQYVWQTAEDIKEKELILVSPDSGANKKTNTLFKNLKSFSGLVKCDKKRSTADGSLSGFEVFTDDLQGKPCLIVDDICDGGRTFIGVGEALKQKNAGDIYLYVTHGIFSNGFNELSKVFKKIYTTNSIGDMPITNGIVKQFKIQL